MELNKILANGLVVVDHICDIVPGVSIVTNAVDLVGKKALKHAVPEENRKSNWAQKHPYLSHLNNKQPKACWIFMIPLVGNGIAALGHGINLYFYYKSWRSERKTEKELAPLNNLKTELTEMRTFFDGINEGLKSGTKDTLTNKEKEIIYQWWKLQDDQDAKIQTIEIRSIGNERRIIHPCRVFCQLKDLDGDLSDMDSFLKDESTWNKGKKLEHGVSQVLIEIDKQLQNITNKIEYLQFEAGLAA